MFQQKLYQVYIQTVRRYVYNCGANVYTFRKQKKRLYSSDIFEDYEDKIQFCKIESSATGDDY